MCTVILSVPSVPGAPVRLLAVRDEDPGRAWNPPGPWWPDEFPGVVGVRDARAGGAWLAADPARSRLAVILNRAEVTGATGSRGAVVLGTVAEYPLASPPDTNGFNLVEVDAGGARVTSWDGETMRRSILAPGVHMIAHDGVDDPATPRIARWLPDFAATDTSDAAETWWHGWLELLERTAELEATDDRAIVRDNRPYGVPTLSLLVCAASIGPDGVELAYAALDEPGQWNHLDLLPPG